MAQYFNDLSSNFADVAFMVKDEWRKNGLGSVMFEELLRLALENGIRGFKADTLAENRGMRLLFQRSGLEMSSSLEDGVHRIKIPFHSEQRI